MQFLKNIFTSFIGSLLAIIIGGFLLIVIFFASISLMIADKQNLTPPLTEDRILKLKLNKAISELGEDNPIEDLDIPLALGSSKTGLLPLCDKIRYAKNDQHVKGLYLDISSINLGYAGLRELREAILDFKESEKPVVAYGEVMSERTYYLASVADKVYLNPAGILEFRGLGGSLAFLKGTLDKLGIEAKVFRVGKFKSAVEPFLRSNMSKENREQYRQFLETIYESNLSDIAKSRNLDPNTLRNISDSLLVRNAQDAVKHKLIDEALYLDEVEEKLKEVTGMSELAFVTNSNYGTVPAIKAQKIAVVVAQGDIVSGSGKSDMIYSDLFVKDLRKAVEDENVKAIVVRINSPGGSALASDVMWREIQVAQEKKPVIASMSDLAASGGYYMAMACDHIVAQPNTITGSIGVFGLLFNTEKFFNDKLGVSFDEEMTGKFTDLGNPNAEMTREDSLIIQKGVEDIYLQFTTKAANSRHMELQDLQEIAQGRVWSGVDALKIGLVDELGGLQKSLQVAAEAADITDYEVSYYPEETDFFSKLTTRSNNAIHSYIEQETFGNNYQFLKDLRKLKQMEGVQTRMPFQLILN